MINDWLEGPSLINNKLMKLLKGQIYILMILELMYNPSPMPSLFLFLLLMVTNILPNLSMFDLFIPKPLS